MAAFETALSYYETIATASATAGTILLAAAVLLVDRYAKEKDGDMRGGFYRAIFLLIAGSAFLYLSFIICINRISTLAPGTEVFPDSFYLPLLAMLIGAAMLGLAAFSLLSRANKMIQDLEVMAEDKQLQEIEGMEADLERRIAILEASGPRGSLTDEMMIKMALMP